jgi:hypothetical protein
MRIVFAEYQTDKDFFNKMNEGELIAIDAVFNYVKGRLMPLKDEMDKEEAIEPHLNNKGVVINYPKNGIGAVGYSSALREKIISSFSQSDIEPLANITLSKFMDDLDNF